MYSYEDRLRAVRLFIKLGERVGLTIRQLGYPTKNALKSWHREYVQRLDLPAGYVRRPKYSQAQKERAVEHFLENGHCLALTIKAIGYPSRTLSSGWVQERLPEARVRIVGRPQELSPAMKQSAVIALCMRQGSAHSVAQDLGVSRQSLYKWKNQLLGEDVPTSMKRQQDPSPSSERDKLEQQIESLRRDIRRLQLEQDLLKKANEILKKDLGIDERLLTNREKTQLVDALRPTYMLAELLGEIGLPRSSFFYHRARLEVTDKYVEVRRAMTDIFECNYRCYGYRRMHAALTRQAVTISEKVVRRLMKQENLVPVARKRRRYGSYMGEISPAPDNVLRSDNQGENSATIKMRKLSRLTADVGRA
jgi:transposase-like protein